MASLHGEGCTDRNWEIVHRNAKTCFASYGTEPVVSAPTIAYSATEPHSSLDAAGIEGSPSPFEGRPPARSSVARVVSVLGIDYEITDREERGEHYACPG